MRVKPRFWSHKSSGGYARLIAVRANAAAFFQAAARVGWAKMDDVIWWT